MAKKTKTKATATAKPRTPAEAEQTLNQAFDLLIEFLCEVSKLVHKAQFEISCLTKDGTVSVKSN